MTATAAVGVRDHDRAGPGVAQHRRRDGARGLARRGIARHHVPLDGEKAGVRDQFKVIIGGAPVTAEYAQEIGADGYAPDASQATTLLKRAQRIPGSQPNNRGPFIQNFRPMKYPGG